MKIEGCHKMTSRKVNLSFNFPDNSKMQRSNFPSSKGKTFLRISSILTQHTNFNNYSKLDSH